MSEGIEGENIKDKKKKHKRRGIIEKSLDSWRHIKVHEKDL